MLLFDSLSNGSNFCGTRAVVANDFFQNIIYDHASNKAKSDTT